MISKKWLTSGLMLLSTSLLVACSGNESLSDSNKIEAITTLTKSEESASNDVSTGAINDKATGSVTESTTETTEPEVSGMNINALAKEDYSSIVGRWVNNSGQAIIIDASGGVLYEDYSDTPNTITLSAGSTEGDLLRARIANPNTPELAPVPAYFVPAGISFTNVNANLTDPTDISKDRIVSTRDVLTTEILDTEVFYRVE